MKKILVIGAGAWGTALANLMASNHNQVFLSANKQEIIDEINQRFSNKKFLPKVKLSPGIKAVSGFADEIQVVDLVFIVTPSSSSTKVFQELAKLKFKKTCGFVICSKGVDHSSLNLLSQAFGEITKNNNYAVLSGPNFAIEVARKVPTITTIASKNKKLADLVMKVLNNHHFQAKYSNDPHGAEICGIVKNIIAIGCGIVDGLGLGVNAKAALVIKGIEEMQLLSKKFKSSPDFANAAGFGDIFLTCSSSKSRNNRLGSMIANGKSYAKIREESKKNGYKTFEGATSAKAIAAIASKLKLQLALCQAINEILSKKFSTSQITKKIIKAILN